eukprot:2363205-Pyramimonas_sp.AAC.1
MPFYDYVYGTMDKKSDPLHASAWKGGRLASDEKADVVSRQIERGTSTYSPNQPTNQATPAVITR